MSDATTTNYLLVEPEVGASADTWGTKLNTNMASIDKLMGAITTTGSANAYVLTTGQSLTAYVAGQRFRIKANFTNSSAATINVDGIGAKSLVKNTSTAMASGDIVSGRFYSIVYDGTNFIVGGVFSDTYQSLDATLTALAALSTSASQYIRATGSDTFTMDSYATVLSNIGAATDSLTAHLAGTETFTGKKTMSGVDFVLDTSVAPTAAGSAGTKIMPRNVQSTNYTFALIDTGGFVGQFAGGTHTYTIPPNSSVAFPIGTVIGIWNTNGAGNLTVAQGSGVQLDRNDGSAAGNATMGAAAWATITKLDTDLWVISGNFT